MWRERKSRLLRSHIFTIVAYMTYKIPYTALGAFLALTLTLTTLTFANQQETDITACISNGNGVVRILDENGRNAECRKNETRITWNQQGPVGPQGEIGPRGAEGPQGPQGEPGEPQWDESRISALETRIAALEALHATDPDPDPENDDEPTGEPYETELTFTLSQNNPDAAVLEVSDDARTGPFTIFVFEAEAEANVGGPVTIQQAAVRVLTEGGVLSDIIHDAALRVGGRTFVSDAVEVVSSEEALFLFDLEDYEIAEGERSPFAFQVEFDNQNGNYASGQTIQASVSASDSVYWNAMGYDDLPAFAYNGAAFGETHQLLAEGLYVDPNSVSTQSVTIGELGTVGEFIIEFDVTAVGKDYYIADLATLGTGASAGLEYWIDGGEPFSVAAVVSSSANESDPGVFEIREGDTETIRLNVSIDPEQIGQYRALLNGFFYTAVPDGVTNTLWYAPFPPEAFQANYITIMN